MTLTLTLPAPCKPLNSNDRLHYRPKADYTALWRARAHAAAIQAGKPRMTHAHVWAVVGHPQNRSYDAGNFYPTAKAALDGIVSAGCLPDDSNAYVVGPDMRPGDKADVFTLTITLDPDCGCDSCGERFGITCDRCGERSPDVSDDGACMTWHCLECLATCRPCQDDMREESDL